MTLALLVALNRGDELRLHLRAARRNGVTRDEIKEVLLQMAVYCGVPAANSAFHLAAEVFAEQDGGARKPAAKRRVGVRAGHDGRRRAASGLQGAGGTASALLMNGTANTKYRWAVPIRRPPGTPR